jgi:hypothetical protein
VRPQDDILPLVLSLQSADADVVLRALASLQSLDPPLLFHSDHWPALSSALKWAAVVTIVY